MNNPTDTTTKTRDRPRILLVFIASVLMLSIITPAVFVYIVDPFQVYHKSFFRQAGYSTEQAYQHAGWIKQLLADPENNYQAIVIGPSTVANYTQALINHHVPWGNTMNLSINGSTPRMQHSVARYALEKNPRIKHILWDVHFLYEIETAPANRNPTQLKFPAYLYNDNILDDGPYLFNISNIETGVKFLSGNFKGFQSDVEHNGPFYEALEQKQSFSLNNSLENRKNNLLPKLVDANRQMPGMEFYRQQAFPFIDDNLLDTVIPLCNTAMDINILFSPTTRFFYASIADLRYLSRQVLMRRYIVEKTQACKNIRVFAFDNTDWIVNNLGNYADNFHYTLTVNDYIMESIAKDENRLTIDNIDSYEKQFIDNINKYKKEFIDQLKTR